MLKLTKLLSSLNMSGDLSIKMKELFSVCILFWSSNSYCPSVSSLLCFGFVSLQVNTYSVITLKLNYKRRDMCFQFCFNIITLHELLVGY